MTLSLSIIKDLRNSSLILTPKNSPFLRLQNLLFTRDENDNITTKLYAKCDVFGFHIVNFPFKSSNIPSAPAYGVYASQLIRYARCCSNYSDFLSRHTALGFHIVNFPFKSSNIPSAPIYGVYASQLIRYARCCSNYSDFLSRHTALVTGLLSQGYKVNCFSNTLKNYMADTLI